MLIKALQPTVLLNEAFSEWFSGTGIFSLLQDPPWGNLVQAEILDMDYFGNHSGEKICSPLVYKFLDSTNNYQITTEGRNKLAMLIQAKFYQPWTKLYDTYYITYNPIENFSISENGTRNLSKSSIDEITEQKSSTGSGTSKVDYGGANETEASDNSSQLNSKWGFNTEVANPQPVEKAERSGSSTGKSTNSGSDLNTTNGQTSENNSRNDGYEGEEHEGYTKTRSGLSGNKSIQELILEDRDLWLEDYFSRIYRDIDSVLTCKVYPVKNAFNPYLMVGHPNR